MESFRAQARGRVVEEKQGFQGGPAMAPPHDEAMNKAVAFLQLHKAEDIIVEKCVTCPPGFPHRFAPK